MRTQIRIKLPDDTEKTVSSKLPQKNIESITVK